MAGPVRIRVAVPGDAAALAALKRQTFRQTFLEGFAIPYPEDDLVAFEAAAYGEAAVARDLADRQRRHWIAETDERLVGYAQTGPCKLPHPAVHAGDGEIYQLYLRRDAQGGGLGRDLLGMALAFLAAHRPGPVWLGVWSGNLKAQAFYERLGFSKIGDYRFMVGSWADEEFIYRS